jgi:hypothetical protein
VGAATGAGYAGYLVDKGDALFRYGEVQKTFLRAMDEAVASVKSAPSLQTPGALEGCRRVRSMIQEGHAGFFDPNGDKSTFATLRWAPQIAGVVQQKRVEGSLRPEVRGPLLAAVLYHEGLHCAPPLAQATEDLLDLFDVVAPAFLRDAQNAARDPILLKAAVDGVVAKHRTERRSFLGEAEYLRLEAKRRGLSFDQLTGEAAHKAGWLDAGVTMRLPAAAARLGDSEEFDRQLFVHYNRPPVPMGRQLNVRSLDWDVMSAAAIVAGLKDLDRAVQDPQSREARWLVETLRYRPVTSRRISL